MVKVRATRTTWWVALALAVVGGIGLDIVTLVMPSYFGLGYPGIHHSPALKLVRTLTYFQRVRLQDTGRLTFGELTSTQQAWMAATIRDMIPRLPNPSSYPLTATCIRESELRLEQTLVLWKPVSWLPGVIHPDGNPSFLFCAAERMTDGSTMLDDILMVDPREMWWERLPHLQF